jgi:uncharacterized protein (DUF433 family)
MGGRRCIRGMRVRVTDILEMHADGAEVSKILMDHPDLAADDIRAAIEYSKL